jgi:integration host factor subunit alpha
MTRKEIIDKLKNQVIKGKDKDRQAKEIIDDIFCCMKEAFSNKENIKITNFGEFRVIHKKERIGRNPKNLKEYMINERHVITFYTAISFRNKLNN